MGLWFRVWGLGVRVQGQAKRFRDQGLVAGFGVKGLGFRVQIQAQRFRD